MAIRHSTIKELLSATEGEYLEFKTASSQFSFDEAGKYCSALSNCGGGKLVLGISDKRPRTVVGTKAFAQPEDTCRDLIRKLRILVTPQVLNDNTDKRVLVLHVAARPMGLPVQYEGTAYWRIGDSRVEMTEDTRRMIYAETGHDFSGDVCAEATMEDLDPGAIEAFRTRWMTKSGNERLRSATPEQLLRDCEAITRKGGITYAALILFGTRPALGEFLSQSEIVFEYRTSNAPGQAAARENFRVGFFSCFDKIWDIINLRNTKQNYQSGPYLLDIPTFNERAVREAVLNAVSHRNYQMSGSIFVRQYNDRIVIENPGGFPQGVTVENILDMSAPRNRRIADILALSGLVERAGQGMNLIYELCAKETKAMPDFKGTDTNFVFMTLNGVVVDEILTPKIRLIEQPAAPPAVAPTKRLVGAERDAKKATILELIKRNNDKGTPFREIKGMFPEMNRDQLKDVVLELRDATKIYSVGKKRWAHWYLTTPEHCTL